MLAESLLLLHQGLDLVPLPKREKWCPVLEVIQDILNIPKGDRNTLVLQALLFA